MPSATVRHRSTSRWRSAAAMMPAVRYDIVSGEQNALTKEKRKQIQNRSRSGHNPVSAPVQALLAYFSLNALSIEYIQLPVCSVLVFYISLRYPAFSIQSSANIESPKGP